MVRSQAFSLPYGMMCYVQTNWSSKAYLNLIQTCKYFFDKHRIIVLENLTATSLYFKEDYNADQWIYQVDHLMKNEKIYSLTSKKFWLTKSFALNFDNLLFPLMKYIYRFEVTELIFSNIDHDGKLYDNLSNEDLEFLCGKNIKSLYISEFESTKITLNEILAKNPTCEEM